MLKKHYKYLFLNFIATLIFSYFFIGKENLFFNSTDWLYGSGDLTNAQLSWKFFLNDIWRFPIGLNPNYGLEISNSIIFTDNIPLLAIFFKLFKPFIDNSFQYFSLWVLISFFLQLYVSYLLVYKITNNNFFSFLSGFLFLLMPFLLFRMSHHFSLGGHWLILYSFYNLYFVEENKKNKHWYFLIFLSLLIHLYFTLMIIIIYFFDTLNNFIKFNNFKYHVVEILKKIIFIISIMFIVGYFESSPINAVSSGYGIFKIDLLSFFDPKINGDHISWSVFLKDLPGTHFEGYTYIGFGNILLISLSFFVYLKNKYKKKNVENDFPILSLKNSFIIIFFLWSLTTNISILGKEIINIDLPKYIFATLSIFSSTGRFAWPVIYILIFFSLLIIYRNFPKTYSISILICLLLVQIFDLSNALKKNLFLNNKTTEKQFNDPIWNIIDSNFENLRTTYLYNNYGSIFLNASLPISKMDNIKTDIILNAAMDRQKAALVRNNLANNLRDYNLKKNTAYIVDNSQHLKQLKFQLSKKDYGFFYRDKFWFILPGKKSLMNEIDVENLNKVLIDEIEVNKEYDLKFKGKYLGFGWSHNFGKNGSWSEGKNSFIFFKVPKSNKDHELEISYSPYSRNNNKNYEVSVFINDKFIKKFELKNQNKIIVPIKNSLNNKNEYFINFEFNGIISPFDIFESPDARKLGFLANSMILKEIK